MIRIDGKLLEGFETRADNLLSTSISVVEYDIHRSTLENTLVISTPGPLTEAQTPDGPIPMAPLGADAFLGLCTPYNQRSDFSSEVFCFIRGAFGTVYDIELLQKSGLLLISLQLSLLTCQRALQSC